MIEENKTILIIAIGISIIIIVICYCYSYEINEGKKLEINCDFSTLKECYNFCIDKTYYTDKYCLEIVESQNLKRKLGLID